jgi:hypothetical protein
MYIIAPVTFKSPFSLYVSFESIPV